MSMSTTTIVGGHNIIAPLSKGKQILFRRIAKLGEKHGLGKKALVEFIFLVVDSAANAIVTCDDAKQLYNKFRIEIDHHSRINNIPVKDHMSHKSYGTQVSKVRKYITFGATMGNDGLDILKRMHKIHAKALGSRKTKVDLRYRSTSVAMYDLIGEQLREARNNIPMTNNEIQKFIMQDPKPETGNINLLSAALKHLINAGKDRITSDGFNARKAFKHPLMSDTINNIKLMINDAAKR